MRAEAVAEADPLLPLLDHSTRLGPLLDWAWPGSGRTYLSPNVMDGLRIAKTYFLERPDGGTETPPEIGATGLLSGLLLLRPGACPWVAGLIETLNRHEFGDSLVSLGKSAPSRSATEKPVEDGTLLRWDAVRLLAEASALRRATNPVNERIGVRHIWFAALFVREGQLALEALGLMQRGLPALVAALTEAVQADRFRDYGYRDDPEAWQGVIARAGSQALLIAPPRKTRSGFTSDVVDDEEPIGDPLRTRADAAALADLVLLEAAEPPLAIGLFGSWGSGKSTLMQRMKREIKRHNDEVQAQPRRAGDGDRQTRRVRRVAQLEFNAWSFIDSQNLWASLTSEIFEQLKAGGGDAWAKAQGAWLVGEVGSKVVEQAAVVEAAKADTAGTEEALRAAEGKLQETKDKRAQAPVEAAGQVLASRTGPMAGRISEGIREFAETGRRIDELGVPGLLRSALALWKRAAPVKLWIATGLLAFSAAAFVVMLNFDRLRAMAAPWVALALASVTALVTAARPLFSIAVALIQYRAQVGEKERALAEQERLQKREVEQARVAHAAAAAGETASAESLEELTETGKDPARLLAYLLTESVDIKAVRSQLGLLGSVRRCFHNLDELIQIQRFRRADSEDDVSADREVARAAREKGEILARKGAPDPTDAIDRIVLYVDDLDRCSARQVVQILEAVHLLLAFKCFVVVVAIDARWLRRSLEIGHSQFDETQGRLQQHDKPSPSDYLEKIFQIPFWVRPMAADGKDNSYVRYLAQLLGPRPASAVDQGGAAGGGAGGGGRSGALIAEPPIRTDDAETPGARVERISLSGAERDLMDRLGPLAAKSPRTVKRLINVYRLIRARLSPAEEAAFLGSQVSATPRFATVQLALALDAGLPADAVPEVRAQLAALNEGDWSVIANNPAALMGLSGVLPAATLIAADTAYAPLRQTLTDANRLPGFVAALEAVKEACGGSLDRGEIERAFALTQRYSFRSI